MAWIDVNLDRTPGTVDRGIIRGGSPTAANSFSEPELVGVRSRSLAVSGSSFELTFPGHSFSGVELQPS